MISKDGLLCLNKPTEPGLPLSSTVPAYSKLNKRRRITCNQCGLPFGYVTMDTIYLESDLSFLYEINKHRSNEMIQRSQPDENANAFTEVEIKDPPISSHYQEAMKQYLTNECDYRAYMSLFLPDAINVCLKRRVQEPRTSTQETKPLENVLNPDGHPQFYKFQSNSLYIVDEVLCVGCGKCVGIRYEPHSTDFERFIINWRKKRITRPSWQALQMYDKTLGDQGSLNIPTSDWLGQNQFYIAEEGGWIVMSLECVNIEPLFGLVGLDQYSVRYRGGEMHPQFYSSIESSLLYSQNSGTWMKPWRRLDARRSNELTKMNRVEVEDWSKAYLDLERADKCAAHTLMSTDLVENAMRELCSIYPIPRRVLEPDEEKS